MLICIRYEELKFLIYDEFLQSEENKTNTQLQK